MLSFNFLVSLGYSKPKNLENEKNTANCVRRNGFDEL
tara:strand:+ start:37444 stop:37554 length:111 start_codon:yes stop_codon:yes gene_type:complete